MLERCHNIDDLRERARMRLPLPVFDFLDGAAEDEVTLRANLAAFDAHPLIPRCLAGVETVDPSISLLGQRLAFPLLCSPTGASCLFHSEGEIAVARAAARAGIFYALSAGSTRSIEAVARASAGPKIFQLYPDKNEDLNADLILRAKQAGYVALCITLDVSRIGKRERDLRHGLAIPMRFTPRIALHFARRPRWLWGVRRGLSLGANLRPECPPHGLDPSLDWKRLRALVDLWGGPVILKGIMAAEDAVRAVDFGASAIMISNHGGRQLDGAAASLAMLPDIVAAVGGRTALIMDGGVRRGTHILKALALGATAVAIGRPYLYGLAAGGEAGVSRALDLLRDEFVLAMQLAGCATIADIGPDLLRRCPS